MMSTMTVSADELRDSRSRRLPKYLIVNRVKVGEFDPMSRAARRASVQPCGRPDRSDIPEHLAFRCTRAIGHAEASVEPAAQHVATDERHVALAVWSS